MAIDRVEFRGQRVAADEAAEADLVVPARRQVVDVAKGQLADAEFPPRARIFVHEELVLVCTLGATEDGVPAGEARRGLQEIGARRFAASGRVAAPCQRSLPLRGAERAVIDRRRRGAVDVVLRMQLLGTLDAAAAYLQCPVGARVI